MSSLLPDAALRVTLTHARTGQTEQLESRGRQPARHPVPRPRRRHRTPDPERAVDGAPFATGPRSRTRNPLRFPAYSSLIAAITKPPTATTASSRRTSRLAIRVSIRASTLARSALVATPSWNAARKASA